MGARRNTAVTTRLKGVTKPAKKALISNVKKGFWTPNYLNWEIMNRIRAEAKRLLQMRREMAWEMDAAGSVMTLLGGNVPMGKVHPKEHEAEDLTRKIRYMQAIVRVMLKLPITKSFNDHIAFLHYIRDAAWKHGMFDAKGDLPTVFDIVDHNGEVIAHATSGEAAFYNPPPELVDAAKLFLRVRRYKANRDLKSMRLVKIDAETSIINLTTEDRVASRFDIPKQCIKVVGNANAMPEWALMMQDGESLGLYRRAADPSGFVIRADKTAACATCKYEVY